MTTSASFRDPSGRVFVFDDRVYRTLNADGLRDFDLAHRSPTLERFVEDGSLVSASELTADASIARLEEISTFFEIERDSFVSVLDHERVQFQSFPYEWSPEMLHAAAQLTLEMQTSLLNEGLGLKDATPYNILFKGPKPVFVDWLSFEKRDPRDHVWSPQAQFIRTFVLPLLANKHFGIPLSQIFLNSRDGIEPEAMYKLCSPGQRFRSPFLTMVTLPKLLGAKANTAIYERKLSDSPEKARFILDRQLGHLQNLLEKVAPDPRRTSNWAEYLGPSQHFTDTYLRSKREFVQKAFEEFHPRNILDVGCNTGYFSRVAAQNGAAVVALDLDQTSVGRVWRMATEDRLDILPLVADISRPSPATGWRNNECSSFLDRCKGNFDAVLMLAVVHHILVTERVPLDEIVSLMAETTNGLLVIEYIPPDDPMFKQIARGRDHLYRHLTREYFETAFKKQFSILRVEKLVDSDRYLYLLRK